MGGSRMEYGPEFSRLLRDVRSMLDQSQDIGRAIELGHGAWQSYEQRTKLPSIANLFKIADRLAAKFPGRPIPSQGQFLEAWLQSHKVGANDAVLRALAETRPRVPSLAELSWLDGFVVTGERREPWARTRLDCLTEASALSDLRHLLSLDLSRGTELVPDKELTALPWDELVRRYGDRDVVAISSGAVNAMTGLLNDDMVFRFDAVPEARSAYRAFIRDMDDLEREAELRVFQQCLAAAERLKSSQDPVALLVEAGLASDRPRFTRVAKAVSDLLGGSTPSQFTSLFRQAVLDPLVRCRHQPEKTFDYAVVSFARHPFGSAGHVALVVAGTNGAATAGAVQALARGDLAGRPLGGVVRVRVRTKVDEDGVESRVLAPEVITPPYVADEVVASIERISDGNAARGSRTMLRSIFGNWSDDDLRDWIELVRTVSGVLARR